MGKTNSVGWMDGWIANFDRRHPVPVPPCKRCRCNTVSVANCTCELENAVQVPFGEHAMYTFSTINAFFLNSANLGAMSSSLGATPYSITSCIQQYTTIDCSASILPALLNHISLAGAYLNALKTNTDVSGCESRFMDQASELATAFSNLNPCVLSYDEMLAMWQTHDQCVIDIANAVYAGQYATANDENNYYYRDNAHMAIMIADGLADIYCCRGC